LKRDCAHIGKMLRMGRMFPESHPYALFVDLSFTSSTGPFPGLRSFNNVASSLIKHADVLIINPGQIERNPALFAGNDKARILIRLDWTNAFRGKDYPLPSRKIRYGPVADCSFAICSGADGVIISHLLGYGDDIEMDSFNNLNKTVRQCWDEGLPVFVHLYPFGPGVTDDRFNIAVEMGVSMGIETGVDAIFIPEVDLKTYKNIAKFCSIPFFIWSRNPDISVNDLLNCTKYGAGGFVFGQEFFAGNKVTKYLSQLGGKLSG